MKDKNLNILSLQTSNPLVYIIYDFYVFITIWLIHVISALMLFLKCDVTKFRILPLLVIQCHT